MPEKNKSHVWLVLLLLFLFFAGGGLFASTEEEEKLKEIQRKLEREKEILKETKKQEQETLSKLVVITKELNQADKDLKTAHHKLEINDRRIRAFTAEIVQTESSLQDKGQELRKRIEQIYKGGEANNLELLLSAKSSGDFINRSYYFGRILERDAALIAALRGECQKLQSRRTSLKNTNEEVKELAELIEDKRETIAENVKEKQQAYESLKERREEYERRVAELERSSNELEQLITRSVAERARQGKRVSVSSGQFIWPLKGRLSSYFGYRRHPFWGGRHFHSGLDIAAPYGSSVAAADAGEVIFSGWWDGYGKAVVVDHGRGFSTVYAHLSRIYVQNGKDVAKGEVIGLVGSTGYSTGPHLHFEVRKSGKPTDPLKWLP